MYVKWKYILYYTNIGWIIDWSNVCLIVWNGLIWVIVIRINVNQLGIFVIPNYRILRPKFQLQNYCCAQHFWNFFASNVFTCTFHCAMSWWSPVGNTQGPDDGVKGATVARIFRLWNRGHNGSLWIHPSVVINIPPGSGEISTTLQNPER